jgi:hypothetical protein
MIAFAVVAGHAQSADVRQSPQLLSMQARADAGQQEGQLDLAKAYLAGTFVPRDRVMAYFWFNLATASGGGSGADMARASDARAQRDKLDKLLAPAQIAQAEAMSREWKPKEVLGSDPLREEFRLTLWTLAFQDDPGYVASRGDALANINIGANPPAYIHRWETVHWFPGATSQACEVEFFDPRSPEEAAVREKIGQSDAAWLICRIFESSDETMARSAFESVGTYIWYVLPDGWMRHADARHFSESITEEQMDFWSDLLDGQHLPEGVKGTHIKLELYKTAGPTYTLSLEFEQKSPCNVCFESDRKSGGQRLQVEHPH